MEFKVIWSQRAVSDLEELCGYIAGDNPTAALQTGRGILEHVKLLAAFPFIGPNYPRESHGDIREIIYRPYRIFYAVKEADQTVDILHVRHGARREPKLQLP